MDDRPKVMFAIFAVSVAAGLIGLYFFKSPSMGLLGFSMVLGSTADYWMGANFKVDSKGAQARVGLSLTAMEWKDVKLVVVEPRAIKLSPLTLGAPLSVFRGVLLRTRPDLRNDLLGLVEHYRPEGCPVEYSEKESPL